MNQFMSEYCSFQGGGMIGEDPTNFCMVLQEKRKLTRAFTPEKTFSETDPPQWTKSD